MKTLLCGLTALVLPVVAQTAATVTLLSNLTQNVPERVGTSVRAELAAIMEPVGYRFDWRLEKAIPSGDPTPIIVVFFQGSCRVASLVNFRPETGPLGATHSSHGQVHPFVDVYCDRLRPFLSKVLTSAEPAVRDEILGRAMARIVAHELYHILAQTRRHAATGLANGAHTVDQLTRAQLHFGKNEAAVLRQRARALAPASGIVAASR